MYDLIGDIHGHATELTQLLQKLGYTQNKNGVYAHPTRKVIFAGDFIDRGNEVREVLQIAKGMTDAGTALAVMGNHEYNILCYHTKNEQGEYLRLHTDKNKKQQQATEDAFKDYREEWQMYLDWMMELPIWLDLGDLRIIHACWQPTFIEQIQSAIAGNRLTPSFLQASAVEGNWEYEAIEILLKGLEQALPDGEFFYDKDGHQRTAMRIQWWKAPEGLTRSEYGLGIPSSDVPIPLAWSTNFHYSPTDIPVFIGHYWLRAEQPSLQSPSVCCLDYSVAKAGQLVGYRWQEGTPISNDNFVWVKGIKQ